MKLVRLVLAGALAASAGMAAVDAELLGLVGPEATVVGGLRADQAKASPFGRFLLTQLTTDNGFARFTAETGFDPRSDLTEVIGASAGPEAMVIIVRGAFQPARILALAQAGGATAEMYRGVSIVTEKTVSENKAGSAAFLNATILVVGHKDLVKGAVDRWITAAAASGPLADRAREASGSAQAWVVSGPLASLQPQNTNGPTAAAGLENLVGSIQGVTAGVTLGDQNIVFAGEATARSAQDAQALVDVLKFLASMADQSTAGKKSPLPLPQTAFTAEGSAVHFSASLTEAEAESLLQGHVAR